MVIKTVIIGSGKSTLPDSFAPWKVVTINNAWMTTPHWDCAVIADDLPSKNWPKQINPHQKIITHSEYKSTKHVNQSWIDHSKPYDKALLDFGKPTAHTMFFASVYWTLKHTNSDVVGFFGCDFDYTPDENGHTHFYGNGTPDPIDFMKKKYKDADEGLVKEFADLQKIADGLNVSLVNFSNNPNSKLPFPKRIFRQNFVFYK